MGANHVATPASPQELTIPDGWVPDGTRINVVAIYDPDARRWEAIIPAFSVASMGGSADDAVDSAMELLRRYFAMCAADGMSFGESHRGMGARWAFAAMRGILRAWRRQRAFDAVHRVRRGIAAAH